ncbi:MAG: replication-associated recombination protein A [Ilumatobacteraceae bacterium]
MESPDLFSESLENNIAERAPLAARLRPQTLDDVVGQDHLVGANAPLRRLIVADKVSSILLWGPPGTGKTTLAELIASSTKRRFERLSAVTAGVKDVREVIDSAKRALTFENRGTVVFIDEIHRFTTTQQDALLHAVESGVVSLIGATTENPAFSVNPALRSRSSVFELKPVDEGAIQQVLNRACHVLSCTASDEAIRIIARRCTGDVRQALTAFEVAIALAAGHEVIEEHATLALNTSVSRLGRNDHYDIISAFIKSMRASEPNTALHWLARMVEGGEDPRFIARRLIIFASEDIGLADHTSLLIAVAAAEALDRVGLPEAMHHLAHATLHLSLAPKSRSVTSAIASAVTDVREGRTGQAPPTTVDPPQHRPLGFDPPRYYRDPS